MTSSDKQHEDMQYLQSALSNNDYSSVYSLIKSYKHSLTSTSNIINIAFELSYNTMLDEDIYRLLAKYVEPISKTYVDFYELVLEDDVNGVRKFLRENHISRQSLYMNHLCIFAFCSSIEMCKLLIQNRFVFITSSSKHEFETVEYLLAYPKVFEFFCLQGFLQPSFHPEVDKYWKRRFSLLEEHVLPEIHSDILFTMQQFVLSSIPMK